jgi:NADH-quinone oxidoreductase subunit C
MSEQEKPESAPKPAPAAHAAPKAPAVMAATPWESELATKVKSRFGEQILEASTYLGQNFFLVHPDAAIPLIDFLKHEDSFDYMVDLTAAHYPAKEDPFELFYILYSFTRNERIRVKTRIKEDATPPTAVSVHLAADWLEREVFDMYGIRFAGHPNMIRLLLPDEWQGHPLRKDVSILGMDNQWVKDNLEIESGQ